MSSLEEAIDWVKRCPNPHDEETEIEIRPVFEADDFGEAFTPELREREERLRAQLGNHASAPSAASLPAESRLAAGRGMPGSEQPIGEG